MASASVEELKDAIKDALRQGSALGRLQASVRSEVFKVLAGSEDTRVPGPCDETLFINELIREYLVFNGYRDTLSVFLPEAGQPERRPFNRSFLEERLNLDSSPNATALPLLYSLVELAQQGARPVAAAPLASTEGGTSAAG